MKKVVKKVAGIKMFFAVGQSYFYDLRYPILLAIALKVYLPSATLFELGIIVIIIVIACILLGWIDLRFINLHQAVQEISTHKYNPYFAKLMKKKFK